MYSKDLICLFLRECGVITEKEQFTENKLNILIVYDNSTIYTANNDDSIRFVLKYG